MNRSGRATINPDDCGPAWWFLDGDEFKIDESLRVVNGIVDRNSGNRSQFLHGVRNTIFPVPPQPHSAQCHHMNGCQVTTYVTT